MPGRKSQGVVGYCRQFRYAGLEEVLANRRPGFKNSLVLLLDSVMDPQNLGSLIRTAFYFGANGVVIPEDRSATITSAAMKASAGAAGRLPVARVVNLARTLDELKEAGYWIYGTDSHSENKLEDVDFDGNVGLVMGSEGSGIRPLVRKKCDLTLSIPGAGEFDSLNVSVAAGIILHRISLTRAVSWHSDKAGDYAPKALVIPFPADNKDGIQNSVRRIRGKRLMAIFLWEARTIKGELKKGEIDASDEGVVRTQLRRKGLKSIAVKTKPKDLLEYLPALKSKVKEKEVIIFARQFSTMINAGLPIVQCLEMLAAQEQNKEFAKIIQAVKEDIEAGSTLSDALKKYPRIFDNLFVNLISAGEAGGILDKILLRLSSYMEKSAKLKSKVKGALVYPISVLVISIAVVAVLLLKVIPVFQNMYSGMGQVLPGPTQFLVNASEFARANFLYSIIGLFVLIVGFKKFYGTEKGRRLVDGFVLKLPVFGELLKKVAVAKFSRTLSTMLGSGVPIIEGLEIVSRTAGNKVVEEALMETRKMISEGKTIAEPLSESGIFPPMVVQMIAVGENTGALDGMLSKIADFYDDEVDAAVASMTSLLEPALMVFLGGTVGGMIIALYLPIFQMASGMK